MPMQNEAAPFADIPSLLQRYSIDPRLDGKENERMLCITRLKTLNELCMQLRLPTNILVMCLVGSFSNNEPNHIPRVTGARQSDLDILLYHKSFRDWQRPLTRIQRDLRSIATDTESETCVQQIQFSMISPFALRLPGTYAYIHMMQTATFLAGDTALFSARFGKYRDSGLVRPDEDISFENWADMH